MRYYPKIKQLVLLNFIILLCLLTLFNYPININSRYNDKSSENINEPISDNKDLQPSKISGPIRINDNIPMYNWSNAKKAGICSGNGTYSEPYIIEDLVIDAGGSGSCIRIESSDVYFRIENCTIYNSGGNYGDAGIRLLFVTNGKLINNDCSSNAKGIYLYRSNNNTISGNTASYNTYYGIEVYYFSDNNNITGNTASYNGYMGILMYHYCDNNFITGNTVNYNGNYGMVISYYSDNNTISGNTASYNDYYGIEIFYKCENNNLTGNTANNNNRNGIIIWDSNCTILSGNIMNECGLYLIGSFEDLISQFIDITNLVNEKPIYYYINEVDLGSNNFTNAGQVILVNCNDSFVSNLNISYSSYGILLYYCTNNTISRNNLTNNNLGGIELWYCNNNNISENIANYNSEYELIGISRDYSGICLYYSKNIIVSGNTANDNFRNGISLRNCDNNLILGNNASNNGDNGIFLINSNYNSIIGNTLLGNENCIEEVNCIRNLFSDNGSCTYGQRGILISVYHLLFLIGIISVVAIILSKKIQKP